MMSIVMGAAIAVIALMLLVLIRVIQGPTVIDRLVAVNVIGTKATVLIILIGLIFERVDMFVDIAIGYALLNFIASIAASKYFDRHKSLSPDSQWEKESKS